jgi:endonuclease-3 related protein
MVNPGAVLPALFDRLDDHVGDPGWWPAHTQLEICLGAILTQNTAWSNVERALENLRSAGVTTLEAFLAIDEARLAALIRPSGYYRQKAKKLNIFCTWFAESYQGDFLLAAREPTSELRRQLLELWGIGPETADAMLCYAFGKPVFVVDAYLARILQRHGLLSENAGYQEIQNLIMTHLPGDAVRYNQAHAQIVEAAKRWCRKSGAICSSCPLEDFLPDRCG